MCDKLRKPDDMLVGAVIELMLGYKLTEVELMQSHVELQGKIKPELLKHLVGQLIL